MTERPQERCPRCGGEARLLETNDMRYDKWWCVTRKCLVATCPGERRKGDRRASEESGPEREPSERELEAARDKLRDRIAASGQDPDALLVRGVLVQHTGTAAHWAVEALDRILARLRASGSPRAIKDLSGDLDFADELSEKDGSLEPTERKWSDADVEAITAVAVAAVTKHYEEKARPSVEAREALELLDELLQTIEGSRKGSIGAVGNTYLPQISVSRVKNMRERYRALATYEGRTDGPR